MAFPRAERRYLVPVMPRTRELIGCVLDGRYELDEVVGEGAFGHVYRGHDRRLGRTVAVKVIKPWWGDDPEWVSSFEREARLLARVSDPGIVQIYDVGQADEGLYYVAEFVDGESLAARLKRGPLSAEEARDIAEQLCRALAHAHAQRVVHRDVKPANVLISREGFVKVGDFGVARLADATTEGAAETVVGTPKYMAPEQANGMRTTPATDVYGVGVVLYEMLAGKPPFTGGSAVELALRHAHESPAPLPASAPLPLAKVVAVALAKDPVDRFRDGGEMADALARLAPDSRRERPRTADARPATGDGRRNGTHVGSRRDRSEDPTRLPGHAGSEDPTRLPGHAGSEDPTRLDGAEGSLWAGAAAATGTTNGTGAATLREDRSTARTAVAPRMSRRRTTNPAARRRTIALFALVIGVLVAMGAGAILVAAPTRVRVPGFHGLSRAHVLSRAGARGLHVVFTRRYSSASAGVAISQHPAAGARVDKGSTVHVALSRGLPPVKVPKLVGQSAAAAGSILASLGLHSRVSSVPAPGVAPGIVTAQTPAPGRYESAHGVVSLSAAETPSWRPLTSFSGSGPDRSVVFRIRGSRWRIVYRMNFLGTCTFIFVCDGPSARIVPVSGGASGSQFGMNDGGTQTQVVRSGPGLYQVAVTPGSDTAHWSIEIQDYY
jgi:serine/threonine-protein kinase